MAKNIFAAVKQKEFIYELVVTQGDITPYGSASFINYVRWYNIARDALLQWRNLGFGESLKTVVETEVSFCNIQYKREAMLQDEIVIKINSSNIKQDEFALLFTLIRKDNALLISLGREKINFRNSKTDELFDLPHLFVQNVLRPIEVQEKTLLFKY
ncbi:MAG: thioesterase family protein [Candidatus Omnitrophota bacterium]